MGSIISKKITKSDYFVENFSHAIGSNLIAVGNRKGGINIFRADVNYFIVNTRNLELIFTSIKKCLKTR